MGIGEGLGNGGFQFLKVYFNYSSSFFAGKNLLRIYPVSADTHADISYIRECGCIIYLFIKERYPPVWIC